jgi:hypothetical protein
MNEVNNFECMVCGKKNPSGGCGRKDCPYGANCQSDFDDEDLGQSPVAETVGAMCAMKEGCEGCQ